MYISYLYGYDDTLAGLGLRRSETYELKIYGPCIYVVQAQSFELTRRRERIKTDDAMNYVRRKGKKKSGKGRREDYLKDGFCYCKADFVHIFFFPVTQKSWVVNVDTGQISRCHSNSSTTNDAPPAHPRQTERCPPTAHPPPSGSPARHPSPLPRPQPAPSSVSRHGLSPPIRILRKLHTTSHILFLIITL